MLRLACALAILSFTAYYAECDETSGFRRIPDYVPAAWENLSDADLKAKTTWTAWINLDNSDVGTGDYENVNRILSKQTNCELHCSQPAAVQWKLADATHEADIGTCLVLKPEKFGTVQSYTYPGFNCIDAYQNTDKCTKEKCIEIGMRKPDSKRGLTCDQCPDFQVQYLCETAKPSGACPVKRANNVDDFERKMEELDTEIETREMELSELKERANELEKREMRELNGEDKVAELRSLLDQLIGKQ